MTKKKDDRSYHMMTADELAEATAEFGCQFVADEFEPPVADTATRWQRAKRKPDRPRRGKGGKVISVSLEKQLLDQTDRLARRKRVSRASLIARGLRAVLKAETGK